MKSCRYVQESKISKNKQKMSITDSKNYKVTISWLLPSSWAWRWTASTLSGVQGMTLNCIHIFIVTGSFLYWCVMRPANQRFFIHNCIYRRILIISYLATFLGTNSLSVLMCRRAVNQSNSMATTRMGWPPNTAPAGGRPPITPSATPSVLGWQQRMATTRWPAIRFNYTTHYCNTFGCRSYMHNCKKN